MAFRLDSKPDLDVASLAEEFETSSVEKTLTWVWETFCEKAAIGTSFQGSGLVIMHHAYKKLGIPLPAFTLDTGLLFPETYELKRRLEDFFEIEIESVEPQDSVDEQERNLGANLWETNPDTCCTMRKVIPLQGKLARINVWITGLRRQQSDLRKERKALELYQFDELRELHILKLNPMVTWSREQIWAYLKEHGIPFNPLHDRGYRSIGCWPCTRPIGESQNERAGRWEGFDKAECGIHTFLGENI
jgi:phosphoadenosine phosphosulfate reductase